MNKLKEEINTLLQKKRDKEKEEQFSRMVEAFDSILSKGVKISEEVVISNFSELIEHLSFEFPDSFKINNPEDIAKYIKIPENKFPEEFKINNLSDIAKFIKFPENKFPEDFKISNFPEIVVEKVEFPENVKRLSFKDTENFLSNIYDRIGKFAIGLKDGFFVSNKSSKESIPVRLSDGQSFLDIPQFKFNKNGKLEVEVDRVGQGGGGGLNSDQSKALINLEANVAISDNQNPLGGYKSSNLDINSDPMYLGNLKSDGQWYIQQIDFSTGDVLYCKGDSDYSTSWADRENLTYGLFSNIF